MDTAEHHVLRLTLAHRRSSQARQTSGTPQTRLRRILREYETHHNQHRPYRSLHGAAPLKPLPEPVDLEQYRVRRQDPGRCHDQRVPPGRTTWTRFSARTAVGGAVAEW